MFRIIGNGRENKGFDAKHEISREKIEDGKHRRRQYATSGSHVNGIVFKYIRGILLFFCISWCTSNIPIMLQTNGCFVQKNVVSF